MLTKYGNTNITYDTIGNPLTIGTATLTWQGRQLTSYTDNGTTVSYTYNADGIRTSKTIVSGSTTTKHEYILSGSQIVRETVYLNDVEQYTLVYFYDETGSPLGMKYREPTYADGVFDGYIFEKNLQGDIVAIYDLNTNKIVEYKYDAWGNFTVEGTQASTIGILNPFRYRGYYYDNETNLYYLQSRYYNSNWGRFINADGYVSTGVDILGHNMFAYCLNCPINYSDSYGYSPYGFVLDIFDYYAIHKKVQRSCADKKGWLMEVYVVSYEVDAQGKASQKRGFLDLYDVDANTFYEVKSMRAYQLSGATEQLDRYSRSIIKSKKVLFKPEVSPTPGSEFVSGTLTYGLWDVSYQSQERGVITYKASLNPERVGRYVSSIVCIIGVITIATIGAFIPVPAGGVVVGLIATYFQ